MQPRGGGRLSPGGPPGQRLTASQKPLAFLLDFDGLILDTELCAWRSWGEEYRRHGEVLDEATWRQDLGSERNLANRLAELRATVGPEFDADACRARRLARHGALVAEQDARAGVRGFIAAAVRGGQQLAVVSSSGDPWVRGHLDRLGLLGCFITLCTGDQVLRTKPAPDLYEMALGRLGLVPSQAVAFEDSERGVQAARAAGIRCVAVPNPVTRDHDFDGAALVVDSLLDPRIVALLNRPPIVSGASGLRPASS